MGITQFVRFVGTTRNPCRQREEFCAFPGLIPRVHRVAVTSSGTLDSLPHNGAVVSLLAACGTTHKASYLDIVMVSVVGPLVLVVAFGSF